MLSIPGKYIGDSWFFGHETNVHCFFLTSPETLSLQERGLHCDFGHAVSDDLLNWEYPEAGG